MSEFFQSLNPLAALGAIFALRIVEVTLSTFRIILLIRGRKVLASTVAFFASLTWLVAAAAVFSVPGLFEMVRGALEESGYRVTIATSGKEGLIAVREEVPDAIVLDLMMPEIDGFQVLEEIRSETSTADLPVLVLTAKELTAADRARLTHNNIQELIQKGKVDRDGLVARVAGMLGERAASEPAPLPTDPTTREAPSPPSELVPELRLTSSFSTGAATRVIAPSSWAPNESSSTRTSRRVR